jgi:hypothetical protein
MIINAKVNSKGFVKGWAKKAKLGLHQLCGHLSLDATSPADTRLLTAMYEHCFGYGDKKGSIKVFDHEGNEVINYYFEPIREEAEVNG